MPDGVDSQAIDVIPSLRLDGDDGRRWRLLDRGAAQGSQERGGWKKDQGSGEPHRYPPTNHFMIY